MPFAEVDPMTWMPFAQLGSFGLIAMGFIWFFWKGAPMLLNKHQEIVNTLVASHEKKIASVAENSKAAVERLAGDHKIAVDRLVLTFEKESVECRNERLQASKEAATERKENAIERDKDREVRHELRNVLNQMNLRAEKEKREKQQ